MSHAPCLCTHIGHIGKLLNPSRNSSFTQSADMKSMGGLMSHAPMPTHPHRAYRSTSTGFFKSLVSLYYHPCITTLVLPPLCYHPCITTLVLPPLYYHPCIATLVLPPLYYHPCIAKHICRHDDGCSFDESKFMPAHPHRAPRHASQPIFHFRTRHLFHNPSSADLTLVGSVMSHAHAH